MKKVLFIMMLGLMFGQTKLETRLFEVNNIILNYDGDQYLLDIQSIIGDQINFASIDVIGIEFITYGSEHTQIDIKNNLNNSNAYVAWIEWWEYQNKTLITDAGSFIYEKSTYDNFGSTFEIELREDHSIEFNISLAITAEFPEEDTDQGDLNDDGSIDVIDVVVLVDMILFGDGDPSQLFDAIKRF